MVSGGERAPSEPTGEVEESAKVEPIVEDTEDLVRVVVEPTGEVDESVRVELVVAAAVALAEERGLASGISLVYSAIE